MVIEEVEGEEEDDSETEEIVIEEDRSSPPKSPTVSDKDEMKKKKGKSKHSAQDAEHSTLTNGLTSDKAISDRVNDRPTPDIESEKCKDVKKTESGEVEQRSEPLSDMTDSSVKKVERTSSNSSSDSNKESPVETNSEEEEETVQIVEEVKRPVLVQVPLSPHVSKLREDGNNLFRKGQYGEAIQKYNTAITNLETGELNK